MGLFSKKEEKCCCSSCNTNVEITSDLVNDKGIKVLGSGCKKCNALEESVKLALEELGILETILHVTDYAEIAKYGVMSTPALVVDGSVVSFGKVLSKEEAIEIIKNYR